MSIEQLKKQTRLWMVRMTKESCCYCGTNERLGKNPKGEIHCASCCKENNDETGLACEPIPKGNDGN